MLNYLLLSSCLGHTLSRGCQVELRRMICNMEEIETVKISPISGGGWGLHLRRLFFSQFAPTHYSFFLTFLGGYRELKTLLERKLLNFSRTLSLKIEWTRAKDKFDYHVYQLCYHPIQIMWCYNHPVSTYSHVITCVIVTSQMNLRVI